jgi:hypothetical protein
VQKEKLKFKRELSLAGVVSLVEAVEVPQPNLKPASCEHNSLMYLLAHRRRVYTVDTMTFLFRLEQWYAVSVYLARTWTPRLNNRLVIDEVCTISLQSQDLELYVH